MKDFDKRFGKDKLQTIPASPGVYRFYGEKDRLIYVGKAKNLRRRLSQYRNAKRCKAQIKMRKILLSSQRLDFEVCESDAHAQVLETQLIQAHRPKWNVVGAFYFLYPQIGTRLEDGRLYLCYTTTPEAFPGFRFHGSFRSRDWTRDGFFALASLLRFISHVIPRKNLVKEEFYPKTKARGMIYGFRQAPAEWCGLLDAFFEGRSFQAIEELSLLLLDRPDAIRDRERVEEELHTIRGLWRHEIEPLKKARLRSGWEVYPVAQKDRDLLFIASRSKASIQNLLPKTQTPSTESPIP